MRVCFFPAEMDGSGHYRCLYPARQLRLRGVEAALPPLAFHKAGNGDLLSLLDPDDLARVDADVYVFHQSKQADLVEQARKLREAGKVVVSDTDDYYLSVPAYNAGKAAVRRYDVSYYHDHGRIVGRRKERPVWAGHMHRLMAESDALTVSTPFLAEAYGRFNANVRVLRNRLDWATWEHAPQQSEVERRQGRVRVGWTGRLELRGGDVRVLAGLIGPFLRRHPHVDFVAAGDHTVHDMLDVPAGQRVSLPSYRFHEGGVMESTAVMDVGLVPLAGNSFNEAKSHLKGMEYAACGIPCIASPSESYRDYWLKGREGDIGLLARRPKDWIRALDLLVGDDTLRREMGRSARAVAAEHTYEQHVGEWEDFYAGLVGETSAVAA